MSERVVTPQYFRIALDIAYRIARGELGEGKKLYGRSVISSEYGVSSETVRRALKLLADMRVVEIKPKSCVLILSADEAKKYVNRFGGTVNVNELNSKLKSLVDEQAAIGKKIADAAREIAQIEKRASVSSPYRNYEALIPEGSSVIGKSLGELMFWHATGATVIAIRRSEDIILSPGPYTQLIKNDVLVFVGSSETAQAVIKLVCES